MEFDPASVPAETLQGNSIIMRLGIEKRPQKAHIPAKRMLRSYLQWIGLQNGKFLWVTSLRLIPFKIGKIDNFVFYTSGADFSVCAKIAEVGFHYKPQEWEESEYRPLLRLPESKRLWIKCYDGRVIKIDPADYQMLFEKNGIHENLKAAYDRLDKAPYHYVEPIPELKGEAEEGRKQPEAEIAEEMKAEKETVGRGK